MSEADEVAEALAKNAPWFRSWEECQQYVRQQMSDSLYLLQRNA